MKPGDSRQGMVIPLVLVFSGLLLLTGMVIWRTNQADVSQIKLNIRRVQATFLAKGALQLALLKARLFPTPLYDAVAYSVGKNPYYVHSRGYAHLSDSPPAIPLPLANIIQGPAFLTGEATLSSGRLTRKNVKEIPGSPAGSTQSDDLNTEDGLTGTDYRVDRYLNFFSLDIADSSVASPNMGDPPGGAVAGQSTISISSSSDCPIMGGTDPYSGSFRILEIKVQGARGNQMYGEETIRVIAVADITSKIAGVEDSWSQREEILYKVRRRY